MSRIPKILHYVFGMAEDFGGKPWSLMHYVCLRSAVEHIKPDQVLFYCQYEPSGPWWDLTHPLVELQKIVAPTRIFGRPLCHVAHQADIVRLQKLIEYGGIYLDADVIVHRNFDALLEHSTVLGREGTDEQCGVANAAILAERGANFLQRWLDQYRSFRSRGRDDYWCEHSVQVPARLAVEYPHEVTLLPPTAFYWPLWTNDGLDLIYRSVTALSFGDSLGNHLWESRAWSYVNGLTPRDVRSKNSNFCKWARPFVADLPDDYGAPSMLHRVTGIRHRVWHQLRLAKASIG